MGSAVMMAMPRRRDTQGSTASSLATSLAFMGSMTNTFQAPGFQPMACTYLVML
jgi:hypothetical protein